MERRTDAQQSKDIDRLLSLYSPDIVYYDAVPPLRFAGTEEVRRNFLRWFSDALKAAHAEIVRQRERIGELLGQVRDLAAEWTQDAIQRITTENTTLKQRVRQLTADSRTLEERLKAARSNLRFQDRRVADLEAQLLDPPPK